MKLARTTLPLFALMLFSSEYLQLQSVVHSDQSGPLSVQDVLTARTFAEYMFPSFSPDGEWIAYTLQDNRLKQPQGDDRRRVYTRTGVYFYGAGGDIWLSHTKSGRSINVTHGKGNSWSPVWSPDGRFLAFYSDMGGQAEVWRWEKSTGTLRRISDAIVRSLANPIEWTPDAKHVVVKILPDGVTLEMAANQLVENQIVAQDTSREKGSTVTVFSARKSASREEPATSERRIKTDPWTYTPYMSDLASIDIGTGQINRLTRGDRIAKYWLSPDGSRIAYTIPRRFETAGSQQMLFDLAAVSISTMQAMIIAENLRLDYDGSSVSWSPDGKRLGYRAGGQLADGNVFVVPATGGAPRNITAARHPSFTGFGFQPPLWDAVGKSVYFVSGKSLWQAEVEENRLTEIVRFPNQRIEPIAFKGRNQLWLLNGGRSTVVNVFNEETKQSGYYKIDLTNGRYHKLLEENKAYPHPLIYSRTITEDGSRIAYLAQDAQHGQDIWVSTAEFQGVKRLTQINPQFERYQMGAAKLIEWRSFDGEALRGALLLPAGYKEGRQYPLIVKVYGGQSLSNNINLFGLDRAPVYNMQLLATRGYAILLPDAPRRKGSPMADLVKTILPGVDKVIDMGVADPKRIGVMGHSDGGYSALSLIVQTPRFAAAMMISGHGNLLGHYGQLSKDAASYGVTQGESIYVGKTPWDDRTGYVENSPIFYLNRVQTPLLIVHGGLDEAVSPFLADEIFVGLRRLGKEVVYAKYDGEGHWQALWGYENQIDFVDRWIAWFDEYLMKERDIVEPNE